MTTERQLLANQKNALKGGVKTEAGKAISRYNARKHGILSKELLIPDEDPNDLSKLKAGFVMALKPQDKFQEFLVETIVSCAWRKQRALKFEKNLVSGGRYFQVSGNPAIPCDTITRYEAALDRQSFRAFSELKELQKTNSR